MSKRVTHKDVAARAGVSVATVSYVVNNGPRSVSPDTRTKVERAIAELGYYPNAMARGLRLQQSSTVGLIIPNVTNPVFAEIALALEQICTKEGFLVLLCNSNRQHEREENFVHMLRAKQVDGVVIIPHLEPQTLIAPLLQARIPVVVMEHNLPGVHCIALDEVSGGRLATQHLIDLGHQRIGYIKRPATSALSAQRFVGYQQALANANLCLEPELVVECGAGQAAGAWAMAQLLALTTPPTAVFTHNDVLAMGALHAIHQAGLSVPQDISIVGYDDSAFAAYLAPPLTTIRTPTFEMGDLAGRTLLELIQNSPAMAPETRFIPTTLIERNSTSILSSE